MPSLPSVCTMPASNIKETTADSPTVHSFNASMTVARWHGAGCMWRPVHCRCHCLTMRHMEHVLAAASNNACSATQPVCVTIKTHVPCGLNLC